MSVEMLVVRENLFVNLSQVNSVKISNPKSNGSVIITLVMSGENIRLASTMKTLKNDLRNLGFNLVDGMNVTTRDLTRQYTAV